ncbi:hypothetical protein [Salinadaptatus halalkaliphilus]|nr:hypothetical protein [Salinadaptatus halalkaliphilus]
MASEDDHAESPLEQVDQEIGAEIADDPDTDCCNDLPAQPPPGSQLRRQ